MNFRKFESIENTYVQSNIDKIINNNYNTDEWIVTEKLHGANFAVYVKDLKVVNFASRNKFVDGSFNNSYDLQDKIIKKISKENLISKEYIEKILDDGFEYNEDYGDVMNYLSNNNIDIFNSEIIFYGELVGDRVQKGIRYTKDIQFYVFDVIINGNPINKIIGRKLSRLLEFSITPEIKIGSFEECCKVNNTFNSRLSYRTDNDYFKICVTDDGFRMYDTESLKLLEDTTNGYCNEAEGIIIEPVEPMFFNNGKRILLKNKTVKFSEKNTGVIKIKSNELSINDEKILGLSLSYLNENRLSSVKSKGFNESAIPFMLTKDIIEEYNKENEVSFKDSCDDYKLVNKKLQTEVNKFIGDIK